MTEAENQAVAAAGSGGPGGVIEGSSRRVDVLVAAFLAGLPALFFPDVLFGAGRFYERDIVRFYYPVKMTLARIVRSGEFPWWNPFYAAGQPMAANPEYSVFYPLQWLIFLPDFDLGFRLHILIHLSIGLVSMYVLLRSLRMSIVPSVYGAIAWGLGGVVLSNINLLPILFVVSWMPLLLFAVRRLLRDGTFGWIAAAGLIGGLQILAGEPSTLIQTWIIAGSFLLWHLVRTSESRFRSIVLFLSAFLLSVSIGAVQLIPAIDLARDTVRARGLGLDLVTYWSFPPIRLAELVHPFLLGFHNVGERTIWWGSELYERATSPFFTNLFSGALVVPLVVAGLTSRGTKRLVYSALTLPFLLLSTGDLLPFYRWALEYGIPVPIRFPEKLVLGAIFLSVVFAASVLDRGLREEPRLLLVAATVAAGFTVLLMAAWMITLAGGATPYLEWWDLAPALITEEAVGLVSRGWMISAVFMAAGTVALIGMRRGGRLWSAMLAGILCIEMLVLSLDVVPRIDPALYQPPPILESLPEHRETWRLFHEADWYGDRFFRNGDVVYWELVTGLYPLIPTAWGHASVLQRDYDLTHLLPTVDLAEAMWKVRDAGQEEWREIFMKMSNARVRLSLAEEPPGPLAYAYPWLMEPVQVEDIDDAPRYYIASEIRRIGGVDEFVAVLSNEVPPERVAFVTAMEPFEPAPATVHAVRETASSIGLDVVAEGRTFLVLSVTHHRYWRATIDGRAAPVIAANVGYQGLIVEPGEHRVELRYRNPVLIAAAPISAGASLLAMLVLVHPRLRRLRRPTRVAEPAR